MRVSPRKILWFAVLMTVLPFSSHVLAAAQSHGDEPSGTTQESVAATPDLSRIIPLATDLSGRLARLENDVKAGPDVSAIEGRYAGLAAAVKENAARLKEIKESDDDTRARLEDLRQRLKEERALAGDIAKPLTGAIDRLAGWKGEWLAEEKRWREWKSLLLTGREPDQLKAAFANAQATIESALGLVLRQAETLLGVQAIGAEVEARILALAGETRALVSAGQQDYLLGASPPMFSRGYFSQFREELWQAARENLGMLSLPSRRFFLRHGWTFVLQFVLFLAVLLTIHRNREALNESERWRFLAARPVSAGLFVGILTEVFFPHYVVFPVTLKLIYTILAGISFTRLLGHLAGESWKRQAAYGVVTVFVLAAVLTTVSLPLPLYRLYILVAAVLALRACLRWAGESARDDDGARYAWALRLASVLLGVIVIAQLFGKEGVAAYLFESSLRSMTYTLAFALFLYMIRGGVHWVFFSSPIWEIKLLRSEADDLSRRVGFLIEAAIVGFVLLPLILTAWGLYGSAPEAMRGFLALGFDAGSQRISLGLVIMAAGIFYGAFLLSWILPKVLLDQKVTGREMERGVRISVGRLIQYFIIFIGFVVTITTLGFDFTKLTIILSALGVGIGFGLQGVVNNFVSGLILLFERPLRVGDTIELDGNWAEIREIGLRSTTVRTLEEADVIVPNADLINGRVTNWTLSNRQVRAAVPVGVAYGSDIPLVIETLLACSKKQEMIAKSPAPQVLFRAFGESSLDFELRAWVLDVDNRLRVISELHQEIDRSFREAGIEIAFPQRDLHLRSVDESVNLRPPETSA